MTSKRDELLRPLDGRFFFGSTAWFVAIATGISGLAPMQPDIEAFVNLVKSNRWHLLLCYVIWIVAHIVVECVRRKLELQRELLRSDPKAPRISTKRAEDKRRRKQHLKTRR
jgi:hypothetical protein